MIHRILFVALGAFLLASCGNSNPTIVDGVQHDTVRSEKLISHIAQDSMIQNGEYIKYYKNGVVQMRGMMKDGKRDGVWKSFYENGSPWSETEFSMGVKNGRTTTWYENEQKRYEGYYTNDKESGKWIYFNEKGVVTKEDNFSQK